VYSIPDPPLLRNSCSGRNVTRTSGSVAVAVVVVVVVYATAVEIVSVEVVEGAVEVVVY
jgi:hypothetical protein